MARATAEVEEALGSLQGARETSARWEEEAKALGGQLRTAQQQLAARVRTGRGPGVGTLWAHRALFALLFVSPPSLTARVVDGGPGRCGGCRAGSGAAVARALGDVQPVYCRRERSLCLEGV